MNDVAKAIKELRLSVCCMSAYFLYVYADKNSYHLISTLAVVEIIGCVLLSLMQAYNEDKADQKKAAEAKAAQ